MPHEPLFAAVKKRLFAQATQVPLAESLYPPLHVAAVLLLAHEAAFAVHGLLDPHWPVFWSKKRFKAQLTHVPDPAPPHAV